MNKNSWFYCHHIFLLYNHPFRRNKETFIQNLVEKSRPPPKLNRNDLRGIVDIMPTIIGSPILSDAHLIRYGVNHNWIKRSIFWDLSY